MFVSIYKYRDGIRRLCNRGNRDVEHKGWEYKQYYWSTVVVYCKTSVRWIFAQAFSNPVSKSAHVLWFLTAQSAPINKQLCWFGILTDGFEIKRQCCILPNCWWYEIWCFYPKLKSEFIWAFSASTGKAATHFMCESSKKSGTRLFFFFLDAFIFPPSTCLNHPDTQGIPASFSFRFPASVNSGK